MTSSEGRLVAGFGGDDADVLFGEEGSDLGRGGAGNDVLFGDDGNDLLIGDEGDDTLDGGNGSDELQGGAGNDSLSGGDGQDFLFGDDGSDTIFGDDGNDVISGSDILGNFFSADDSDGSDGDSLVGGAGDDSIQLEGNDTAEGGLGSDDFAIAFDSLENLSGENQEYYVTVLAVNNALLSRRAFSGAIYVDNTPPVGAAVVELATALIKVLISPNHKPVAICFSHA